MIDTDIADGDRSIQRVVVRQALGFGARHYGARLDRGAAWCARYIDERAAYHGFKAGERVRAILAEICPR